MVLSDHFTELLRAQLIGERAGCVLVEARGREQRGSCFSARSHPDSPVEHNGDLLAAAADGNMPSTTRRTGHALKLAGAGDALVVYRDDYVAALEAEIASIGPVVHVDDDHPLVGTPDLQLVSERGRQVGNPGAGKRRTRANRDLVARCRRCRLQRDLQGHFAAGAQHGERCRTADWFGGKAVVEGVYVVDRLRVDRGDDIAGLQSTAFRRTAFGDAGDQRADWTL